PRAHRAAVSSVATTTARATPGALTAPSRRGDQRARAASEEGVGGLRAERLGLRQRAFDGLLEDGRAVEREHAHAQPEAAVLDDGERSDGGLPARPPAAPR